MRDRETIDSELRRLAAMRRAIREQGGQPSSRLADELLDERLGHRADASETGAVGAFQTEVVDYPRSRDDEAGAMTPYRHKGVPRRFGLLAALPLSLIAIVAAVLVVIPAAHNPAPAAQPTQPPSASPAVVPPSGARANPPAP